MKAELDSFKENDIDLYNVLQKDTVEEMARELGVDPIEGESLVVYLEYADEPFHFELEFFPSSYEDYEGIVIDVQAEPVISSTATVQQTAQCLERLARPEQELYQLFVNSGYEPGRQIGPVEEISTDFSMLEKDSNNMVFRTRFFKE